MTGDTLAPAAPHTTATKITALAPMMNILLNAALSCGTKRAYRRAISSYANFCRIHFPVVQIFPASACVLGAFIAHLHSQRYAPATLRSQLCRQSRSHPAFRHPKITSRSKEVVGYSRHPASDQFVHPSENC